MLKNIVEDALLKMLHLYNRVWEEGRLPKKVERSDLSKDPSKPTSYRPIALSSKLCKVMERMIIEMISYELEKKGKLANYQSGFSKGKKYHDALIRLDNEIRKAQENKETVIAEFKIVELLRCRLSRL